MTFGFWSLLGFHNSRVVATVQHLYTRCHPSLGVIKELPVPHFPLQHEAVTKVLALGRAVFKLLLLEKLSFIIDTTYQEQRLEWLSMPGLVANGRTLERPLRVSAGHPGFSQWSGPSAAGQEAEISLAYKCTPVQTRCHRKESVLSSSLLPWSLF